MIVEKIIDGICTALSSNFGDDCEIYTEEIEQDLKDGSFAIVCLNPTNSRFMGNRYYRTNQFCIHYFPKTNEPRSECLDVLEGLYDALELIEFGDDLLRGTNMSSEMDGSVLHFFVNYDFYTIHKEEKDYMEHFDHVSNTKG